MPRPRNHLAHITAAIQIIASELIRVAQDATRSAAPSRDAKSGKSAATKNTRKALRRLSPKVRKLRQQQGLFMGLVRALPKNKREALKKLRREKGYAAAIAATKRQKRGQ